MAAAAQQYAPKKQTPRQPARQAQEKKRGIGEKLRALPVWAGVAAMILLLALSLPVGNFRALKNAEPGEFYRQGDVRSIVEDRIDQAFNVVTAATHAGLDEALRLDVLNAMEWLEEAKSAREISRADQKLTAAVSELTTMEIADAEAARSMQRAADNFAEQGSFLRQEAREYNKRAQKAQKVYDGLLLKSLFAQPDLYEGI